MSTVELWCTRDGARWSRIPLPPGQHSPCIVEVNGDVATPRYVRHPFRREPDFGATCVIYRLDELLARAENPQ